MKMVKAQNKCSLVWIKTVNRWFWVTPAQARRLAKKLTAEQK